MKCRWAVWLCHGAKAHVCILIQFSCPLCASYRMTCDRILQNQYQTKIIKTNWESTQWQKHFCWTECGSSFALVKITDHAKLLAKWMHSFAPFGVHSTQSRFTLYTYHLDYVCNFKMFAVDDIGLMTIRGETWFVSCSFKHQESEWINFFRFVFSVVHKSQQLFLFHLDFNQYSPTFTRASWIGVLI